MSVLRYRRPDGAGRPRPGHRPGSRWPRASATRATGWCSTPARGRARPCRTFTPTCSAAVPLLGPPD